MLAALDQAIRDFWLSQGRPPGLADYTPYMLAIGWGLAWFTRGLIGDCVRDFHYRARRRALRVIAAGPGTGLRGELRRPLSAVPPSSPGDAVRTRSRI